MCVRKTKGGYKYGSKGKTYKSKAAANKQAAAAHANKGRSAGRKR